MNLLINLFSETQILNKSERRFSAIRNYDFYLSDVNYMDSALDSALKSKDEIYISSIKYGLLNERNNGYFLGANLDTHFNLEAMNISKRSRGYIVVYSVNKILPLIFNLLCGSDFETISMIEGIGDISDSILNLDFTRDLYVNSLLNVDDCLDEYLKSFFGSKDSSTVPLQRFVSQINSKTLEVIKYIVSHLESYSNLSVLSVDKSRIMLSSYNNEAPRLNIKFGEASYILNPLVSNSTEGIFEGSKEHNFCEVVL